jgi:hypothetical protein
MKRRLSVVALASLALGACADLSALEERLAKGWVDPAKKGEPARAPAPYVVADVDSEEDTIDWGSEPRVASKAQAGSAEPPAPRRKPDREEPVTRAEPDPNLLVGLDFEATKALLGVPTLKMEQPPAQVWAYNGGSCLFSVFFYPSMDDSVFRVLTYEVTDKEPTLPVQTAAGIGGTNVASATPETGNVKIRDRASPVLRRCFAQLLHGRELPDAG